MDKIHPDLFKQVSTLSNHNIDCLLYANNFEDVKSRLDKFNYK